MIITEITDHFTEAKQIFGNLKKHIKLKHVRKLNRKI